MQRWITPVRWHLAPAGTGVVRRPDSLQEHLIGFHAQSQTQGSIAVIRIEPIVSRPEREPGSDADGFMSGTGHLKINFLLALEQDLPVVDPPGHIPQAIRLDELVA